MNIKNVYQKMDLTYMKPRGEVLLTAFLSSVVEALILCKKLHINMNYTSEPSSVNMALPWWIIPSWQNHLELQYIFTFQNCYFLNVSVFQLDESFVSAPCLCHLHLSLRCVTWSNNWLDGRHTRQLCITPPSFAPFTTEKHPMLPINAKMSKCYWKWTQSFYVIIRPCCI